MSENLLIGTYGWDHDEWQGGFYADDLPGDWRFCFYSNAVRSVLVPGTVWDAGRANPRGWMEDSDPGFRFVLELPPALSRPDGRRDLSAISGFAERAAPLAPRTAGWLLRVDARSAPDADWLRSVADAARAHAPLCVDLPPGAWRSPEHVEVLAASDAALCWRPGEDAAPADTGRFLVAVVGDSDLKALRWVIETLGRWMGRERGAGLFFDRPAVAPRLAEQARILAELLEV